MRELLDFLADILKSIGYILVWPIDKTVKTVAGLIDFVNKLEVQPIEKTASEKIPTKSKKKKISSKPWIFLDFEPLMSGMKEDFKETFKFFGYVYLGFKGFFSVLYQVSNYLVRKIFDALTLIQGVKKKRKKAKEKAPKKRKTVARKIKKEEKRPRVKRFSFTSFFLGIFFGLVTSTIFIFIPFEIYQWYRQLPNPDSLISESVGNKSTRILDSKGRLLYEIYLDKQFEPVKLNQVPEFMIRATLAVEDAEFYSHNGIRLQSIIRAGKKTLIEGELQGGSTITQQLIKNVLLTPERTVSRKLKEVVLAVLVDNKYSKNQILEMYLNNTPYGGTSWGVQSASLKFFNKNVWELNLSEAALLAGLPTAPTRYSPLSDLELAKERQKYVLERMINLGYITDQEGSDAYLEGLEFAEQTDFIEAPHFVDYVRRELESLYGRRYVDFGGLTVKTSLDLDLQKNAQRIVTEGVAESEKYNISNGAAVILDAKEAKILAYVGSVDYFKESWGAYDVATAYRQPGSSIKPVTYALALSGNYTPAFVLKDEAVTYKIAGQPPYKPVNYDGKYHGNVTLRAALANSYNIPAVRLSNSLGPDNIVSLGKKMGLSNWEVDGSYGLSVTLGGKEVRLLDHTNVYGTFAREGTYKKTTPFISIKDSQGYEIYWDNRPETQPLSKEVAYLIWHILSDNGARTPAFGSRSDLYIEGYKVAAKTGTTDQKRDNWTMGYTPSYAVGVWVGNNNNEPMNKYVASGLSGASPIWKELMTLILDGKSNEEPKMPEDVFIKVDESCKPERSEVFIKGSKIPKDLCPVKKDKDKDDKDRD